MRGAAGVGRSDGSDGHGDDDDDAHGAGLPTFPIIVIPDSQAVTSAVMEALVLAGSHTGVPFCLLLGVCTTLDAFHSHLTVRTSSRLAMKRLYLQVSCVVQRGVGAFLYEAVSFRISVYCMDCALCVVLVCWCVCTSVAGGHAC